ncbi:uncharacterized protein LOC126014416 [Suncus etruscus]|uniref:uncharacterized protein LOC126014416 n=1 Tax=Suncus etruscus TaxID=109475 RepID=UPI0021102AD2|nr:uncharacterized protein LOC126014416 [Suncus etruscus]
MFLKQGLSLPVSAGTEGTCDSTSQAPYSIQQPLQNPAEVSFQAGYEQDYQDPPRFFFTSQFTNPIGGAHMHGTMESETPTLPMYKCSDTTSNMAQKRSYRSRLQELVAGQSKTPAKVLAPQSQDFQHSNCGNHWSTFMESSKAVGAGEDNSCPQEELPPPPLSQEYPGNPGKRSRRKAGSSQLEQQHLTTSEITSPSAQLPGLSSEEATKVPTSTAPSCLLQDAVEDQVVVFDMATGNTKIGLLCHDPKGSRSVLVGLVPSSSANPSSENEVPDQPKPVPACPTNNHSNFWPVSSMNNCPEVALVHKDSTFNLKEKDNPQPVSPQRPPCSYQHAAVEQPPITNQFYFPSSSPLPGTPLDRKPPQELSVHHEPSLSNVPQTTRENAQVPDLYQERETKKLPDYGGTRRVSPTSEEAEVHLNREKAALNDIHSSKGCRIFWQPGNPAMVQDKPHSLYTLSTPGPGCKVLPVAMVRTDSQGSQLKLTDEDVTHSSMVAHLGLLHGTCYELVSPTAVLPAHTPVLCHQPVSPYQKMTAVVIDTGSGFTKCGLAGEDHVLSVVSSYIQLLQQPVQGQPRFLVPKNQKGSYSVLNRGVVSDWDALEVLWQHLFYCRLGIRPEELAVLVADSPISPRTNREKMAEILFERFQVPAMQTVHQALLALYAYGRTTGLVLGSGHGTSYVTPILTGDLAPMDTYRLDVAGCDLTENLAQLLLAGSQSLPRADLVNQIKEACCYVAMDMAAEQVHTQGQAQMNFVLPDKQVIKVGSERFCVPEALFQPHLIGVNQPGLPQLALLSINQLEAKQQEQLLANVVLEGGTTLLRGFPERIKQELSPGATVLASPHRAFAAWLGGSIMASREAFQSLWLSRREYEEEGPWAIYKYQL